MKLKPNDVIFFAEYSTGPLTGLVVDSADPRILREWIPDLSDMVCVFWSDGSWSNEEEELSDDDYYLTYVGNTNDSHYEQVKSLYLHYGMGMLSLTLNFRM